MKLSADIVEVPLPLKVKSAAINRFEDARLKSLSNRNAVEALLE